MIHVCHTPLSMHSQSLQQMKTNSHWAHITFKMEKNENHLVRESASPCSGLQLALGWLGGGACISPSWTILGGSPKLREATL